MTKVNGMKRYEFQVDPKEFTITPELEEDFKQFPKGKPAFGASLEEYAEVLPKRIMEQFPEQKGYVVIHFETGLVIVDIFEKEEAIQG
ncbi:hypothetical protein [Neobacillus vireti]|uniref:hypothetical protein n=1 Tax=Neobacillus vireti TaxID=220686 RepID=UPI002FFFEF83